MTISDVELATLAQQGDLASFCPHCHAGLNVYDDQTKRVWVGLDVSSDGETCDLLVNPRLEEFERVCSAGVGHGRRRRALPVLWSIARRG